MKITAVEAFHLRLPKVEYKSDGTQEVMVARVTTDEGLVGYGEAVTCASVARAVIEAPQSTPHRNGIAVALIGKDPLDPESRWQDMYDATSWYGRRGVVIHAMSSVDTALWDIVGKAAGKPCHALWGTRRDRVRAYASMLFPDTASEAAQTAALRDESGFTAVKFGWGSFGYDDSHDRNLLRAIRGEIGDKISLMVDAGRRWTAQEAIRRAGWLFDEFDITWLEEPVSADDIDGYRQVAQAVAGRIAGGEAEETLASFDSLIDAHVKVLQPDVGRAGGLTMTRKISTRAYNAGVWCVPHCFGSGISLAASLHWMASAGEAQFNEFPVTASPLLNELVSGLPSLIDGDVTIPKAPGLGLSVNDDVLEKYRIKTL